MRKLLLLAAAVLVAAGVLAGCASGGRGPAGGAGRPVAIHVPTKAANKAAAWRDAHRLLRALLPPGARTASSIPNTCPTCIGMPVQPKNPLTYPGFVGLRGIWRVRRSLGSTIAFIEAHPPPGGRLLPFHRSGGGPGYFASAELTFSLPGIVGRSSARWAGAHLVALPGDRVTAVQVDVREEWIQPLPPSERVPQTVRQITIRSRLGGPQSPALAFARVRDPAEAQRIVAWFDLLGAVPSGMGCPLEARIGPLVTFDFYGPSHRLLGHAGVPDTEPGPSGCDGAWLTVGEQKPTPVVGGDVLQRVQRLLGLNLNPLLGLRCPERAPRQTSLQVATARLVHPGAFLLELCRYSGLNAPHRLRLLHSRLIRNIALIDTLTREMNALPQRHGAFSCPFDDGSEIVLIFDFGAMRPERVVVGLRGCHIVTNGRTDRLALWSRGGTHLVKQLRALTR